jgi:TonB-dependent SusC/RagA subfamily outer membrane receptor
MMRSRAVVISTVALCACASDRGITGPAPAPAPSASVQAMAAMKGPDPADVEAIEVLKGAAAAAIYGRGAAMHAVFIITTRKAGQSRTHAASAHPGS